MSFGLQIELEEIDRKIILRLNGRIDAASAPILERRLGQLIDEKHLHLILDFTGIDYLSSAGMRVLLSVTKRLKAMKGHLILFNLDDEVAEIVKMAGFDRVLYICSNEKEALQFRS